MNLSKETTVHFAATVISSVAGFIATLVIARFLGASALGVYSLVVAVLFWIQIFPTGVQIAMTKRMSEGTDRGEYFTAGLLTNLALFTVLAAVILAFRAKLNGYFGSDITVLFVALLGAKVLFAMIASGLGGQKSVGISGLVGAFERIARTVAQVALILLSYAVSGLVVGHVVSLLVAAAVGAVFFSFDIARPRLEHMWDLYDYAKYAWVTQLQGKAYGWLDTIMLGFFVSSAFVGIYEVAWSITSFLVLLNKSIQTTLFPEVSDLSEQGDYKTIHEHFSEGLAFSGLIIFPGFVGALVLGSEGLKIYNSDFTAGTTVLLILIVARMSSSVGKLCCSMIHAVDRPEIVFRIDTVTIAFNLAANLVLITQFGWEGAAIATALTGALNLAFGYVALGRLIGWVTPPAREFGLQLLASAVMGIVVWGLKVQLPANHYVTVGLIGVGAAVYTLVLGGISPRFRSKITYVAGSFYGA